ncbi:exopolyphosphatase/guanosine-5'-triphosphate,3'-diphosphate pyrophosphatase [Anaerosolibacter carboniphilus]|uniref:Exopolyphosphatase/guanosine-5'-triphosphate, 3'-diphosphate pyrophosphatase n=1 Tax=Anaerosolibacter carboniphilus TaxID=1417629 RepID=A0A841KYC7_9FIRM|nr:Ppx/GppA phosphatase family protein [Anaerosolibacter carboniphilus]MBB6218471.1 exopolyphosphatase/guanosine-5'-triphosphate,3'-diphosphate pyrophosphatase [Anaerosolibacter carboniphilus]
MKKYAAIDIGTNSMRLLIADVENGEIVRSFKDLETTRMGEGVDHTGRLTQGAIERNLEALKKFNAVVQREGISSMPVIATSAVRDAQNREIFLQRARQEVGLDIDVITGDREAQLGFSGVLRGLKEKGESILVIDIGGGSTEFILGNENGIQYMVSHNIGAVRMTEKCVLNDPLLPQDMRRLEEEIDLEILPTMMKLREMKIDRVIGIGGTTTTIAAVHLKLAIYDRDKVHNTDVHLEEVRNVLKSFLVVPLSERKKIQGLHPKRADVITAGTVILDRILTLLKIDEFRISEYDNLEGLIFEQLS